MNIILGAFGQVGREVCRIIGVMEQPVRKLTSRIENIHRLDKSEVVYADYSDVESLLNAFSGGSSVLLLAPENIESQDVIADSKKVIENYRQALEHSSIRRVVILSSVGSQSTPGTGTLQLYHMIEQLVDQIDIETIIVRPSYYYSNWNSTISSMRETGILATYFPADLEIPMVAPRDVARVIAEMLVFGNYYGDRKEIIEVTGPRGYTPQMIAEYIGDRLKIIHPKAIQLSSSAHMSGLIGNGFSWAAAKFTVEMTETIINKQAEFTTKPTIVYTSFFDYIRDIF